MISIGVFASLLDLFIVNITFPDLQREFAGTGLADLSRVLNGYAIVNVQSLYCPQWTIVASAELWPPERPPLESRGRRTQEGDGAQTPILASNGPDATTLNYGTDNPADQRETVVMRAAVGRTGRPPALVDNI